MSSPCLCRSGNRHFCTVFLGLLGPRNDTPYAVGVGQSNKTQFHNHAIR